MEVLEAIETLGLEELEGLSAEQLKRSYLRKVRQHPPERDPEGFQRVRQAYELLQQRPVQRSLGELGARSEPLSPPSSQPEAQAPEAPHAPEASVPVPPLPSGSDAFERLRVAVGESKWVTAGNALLELYAGSGLSVRLPPPEIALRISLELFENGKHKTARRVMDAFNAHLALHGARVSGDSASAFKLLAELSELSRAVDPALTCALAEAIRSGAFQEAAPELKAEMEQYGADTVTALMKSRAPTLFAATWPYAAPRAPSAKRSWRMPWKARLSLFGVYALFRLVSSLGSSPSSGGYVAPAAAVTAARGARRNSEPSSVVSASDAQRLQDITGRLEKLYEAGKCDETRAAWDQYLEVARPLGYAPSVREGYALRRTQVVRACPTLDPELPQEP